MHGHALTDWRVTPYLVYTQAQPNQRILTTHRLASRQTKIHAYGRVAARVSISSSREARVHRAANRHALRLITAKRAPKMLMHLVYRAPI
jgi:hypothetical protein